MSTPPKLHSEYYSIFTYGDGSIPWVSNEVLQSAINGALTCVQV